VKRQEAAAPLDYPEQPQDQDQDQDSAKTDIHTNLPICCCW